MSRTPLVVGSRVAVLPRDAFGSHSAVPLANLALPLVPVGSNAHPLNCGARCYHNYQRPASYSVILGTSVYTVSNEHRCLCISP